MNTSIGYPRPFHSTKDPRLSAALVEKAADLRLRAQMDHVPLNPDTSPLAPDVQQED
jgi:hypothetical protein